LEYSALDELASETFYREQTKPTGPGRLPNDVHQLREQLWHCSECLPGERAARSARLRKQCLWKHFSKGQVWSPSLCEVILRLPSLWYQQGFPLLTPVVDPYQSSTSLATCNHSPLFALQHSCRIHMQPSRLIASVIYAYIQA
jgi:hypothetical protein